MAPSQPVAVGIGRINGSCVATEQASRLRHRTRAPSSFERCVTQRNGPDRNSLDPSKRMALVGLRPTRLGVLPVHGTIRGEPTFANDFDMTSGSDFQSLRKDHT